MGNRIPTTHRQPTVRSAVRRLTYSALCLMCLAMTNGAQAQTPSILADTSSPRATLESFDAACSEYYQLVTSAPHFNRYNVSNRPLVRRILDCIDISELPEYERLEQAAEAAVCIKEILDRVELLGHLERVGRDLRGRDEQAGPGDEEATSRPP